MADIISIQQARLEDLEHLQRLFRKMFEIYHVSQNIDYPYTEGGIEYLKKCISGDIALVAKDRDIVVGFITGAITEALPFKAYKTQAYLQNLFILEEYRRQGVGRKLVGKFKELCRKKGADRICTDSEDIEELRRFYDSIGFVVTGVNYELKL